jgi:endonuclease/exonuclease/phosphatase family metal-dependent hydrolase
MIKTVSNILKRVFLIICSGYSAVYLLACLTPFINPVHFFPLTFLSLGFPFLLAGIILLLLLSIIFFRKYFWLLLLIIALGYKNISSVFSFRFKKEFVQQKHPNSFRLLSWNVNYFLDCRKTNDTLNNPRRKMFDFVKNTNADVLCFQDFSSFYYKDFYPNLEYLRDSLQYPYTYFPVAYSYNDSWGPERYGVVILSRFPIINSGSIKYNSTNDGENFAFADIKIQRKLIRFYCTHLQSMQLHTRNASEVETLHADTALIFHSTTFKKLKHFEQIHISQAWQIRRSLDSIQSPLVFCGDINSVPSSYVYHTLKKNLQDAFLQKGYGFGRTYDSLSPTLRIDVVFLNNALKATQYFTPRLHLSDHLPNVVDIQFR